MDLLQKHQVQSLLVITVKRASFSFSFRVITVSRCFLPLLRVLSGTSIMTSDEENDSPKSAVELPQDDSRQEGEDEDRSHPPVVNDFLQDDTAQMTFGRRVAMYLMQHSQWYNPRLLQDEEEDDNGAPSLAKAWAYFEHVTLQRYIDDDDDDDDDIKERSGATTSGGGGGEASFFQRSIAFFHQGDRPKRLAEPGDKVHRTRMYSPITTPLSQMGDFGIGYGLYFTTIRSIAMLSFVLGIINIPTMLYFASTDYDATGKVGIPGFQKTSAICTDQSWVPCPHCSPEEFQTFQKYPHSRTIFDTVDYTFPEQENGTWLDVSDYVLDVQNDTIIYDTESITELIPAFDADDPPDGVCSFISFECYADVSEFGLTGGHTVDPVPAGFALRNNCDGATRRQGFVNYASLFVLICGALIIYIRNNRMEIEFDEDEQTAQDYSILVKNPPPDAYDPQEWKDFFEGHFPGAHVAVCTVNVDNDALIQTLVARRELLRKLEFMLPPGHSVDVRSEVDAVALKITEERGFLSRLQARFLTPGIPEVLKQVDQAAKKIEELSAKKYPVNSVFITFETETAQRKVLTNLDVGKLSKQSSYKFRDSHILRLEEPEEPSTIRWQEQGTSEATLYRQVTVSTITSIIAICVALVVIQISYSIFVPLGGIVTAVATTLYPTVACYLTKRESHATESEVQKWQYIKIALFNVAITSLFLQIATPFDATLEKPEGSIPGLITNVHVLFFSQLLITPGLQIADFSGHINRHFFAPRAKTQAEMNILMKGTEMDLSIRYANMTKFVFLMVWYCAIYPAAFFMGSVALFISYFVDKFCLMRSWGHAPQVGTHLAHFARNYVFPIGFIVMSVISSYSWSGFPFDNLCMDPEPFDKDLYLGEWTLFVENVTTKIAGFTIYDFPGLIANFNITNETDAYRYCNQDLRSYGEVSFPALPTLQREGFEWMTDNQERVTIVYGWTTVAVVAVVVISIAWRFIEWGLSFFIGIYRPRGRDMKIDYSTVAAIDAYIPQVKSQFYE